ncbi:16S rRNA (cytidine(1402)-2'-O)-methyltransferase [Virgibacillus sp. 179-BFC.A HS]|uniref:Ribosomal RNA small subunit methyltransferase I n=1 Tax=Tigheibacillus jepli TaxID=3035914 RepID=A0ABU5CDH5_9BACI|nr:16S rRNA (cytidine(1402)-2'-O)-methyltransferase [Virgibacillus sp. 179-BFC.A HS]MDY0404051.1 16S rRNA (cytidine(1402)-2'-O)-methyltransferase [Virgibacillus sp. 179-BFC.A HS]
MQIQKSFEKEKDAKLYIVPTPIGNLEDITIRALNTLKEVDAIAAEDTRNTQKLLNHFEMKTPLISYHEHNKQTRGKQLIEKLQSGQSIALVSDAGMPAISDPGQDLVNLAVAHDIDVVVLPGANAALCALIGSGLDTKEFLFYGFLPRKKKEKEAELARLYTLQASMLFYESPYRVKDTLEAMQKVFGHDRQAVLARELTKRFEEYSRGTLQELIDWTSGRELKGEFCIVVSGNDAPAENQQTNAWWQGLTLREHVVQVMEAEGLSSKDAVKHVAVARQLPKREVYQAYHQL